MTKWLKVLAALAAAAAMATAQATPLATFAWATARDYVGFPIHDEDVARGPFQASGSLVLDRPQPALSVFGQKYVYDYSLIAYFEFLYEFIGDHGEFIDGQSFSVLFDSPDDYIVLGRIPFSGMSLSQTFEAQDLIATFNDRFHGLQDNSWSITGFRASLRHIYQVGQPTTGLLLCLGLAVAAGVRRTGKSSPRRRGPVAVRPRGV